MTLYDMVVLLNTCGESLEAVHADDAQPTPEDAVPLFSWRPGARRDACKALIEAMKGISVEVKT